MAANRSAPAGWRYIVVQWQPWRSIPAEVQALGVGGIPHRGAYVRGQQVGEAGGRVTDIELLAGGTLAAQAGQSWSPPLSPPQPPIALLKSEAERPKLSREEVLKRFIQPTRAE